MRYVDIVLIVIAACVAGIYFVWELYLWPIILIMVAYKIRQIYNSNKSKESKTGRLSQGEQQLICIMICFVLLFSVDSYYRESGDPYRETDLYGRSVARFEKESEDNEISVNISEIENSKFGQYYHITSYVSKTRAVGNFRVFKEKDIKYETPEIIEEKEFCKIIIKRKNMDDLVYIIPYYNVKE